MGIEREVGMDTTFMEHHHAQKGGELGGEAGARMVKEMAEFLLLAEDPFRIEYLWDRM